MPASPKMRPQGGVVIFETDVARYLASATELRAALSIPADAELDVTPIGQGEYNANYRFMHPETGQQLVLRVNTGSQMHLDNQIRYEFDALRLLEPSGRTPLVCFVDDSLATLPHGVLVMEFLPGRPLLYETDLAAAAAIFADIHAVPVPPDSHLVRPDDLLGAVVDECRAMLSVYSDSAFADPKVSSRLWRVLERAQALSVKPAVEPERHIISTEVNSGNFLINPDGHDYLVDWEKPILGEVAQDLGHFLAPTTTLWKTETILSRGEIERFLGMYRDAVDGRFATDDLEERFDSYLSIMCARGLTWCAMAYVEYQDPARPLKNADTYAKIMSYLEPNFLDRIAEEYLR